MEFFENHVDELVFVDFLEDLVEFFLDDAELLFDDLRSPRVSDGLDRFTLTSLA